MENHQKDVDDKTREVARINTEYEQKQNKIPSLRNKDIAIAAELQKYSLTFDNFEKEVDRIKINIEDLNLRVKQIEEDIIREKALSNNAQLNITKVKNERNKLEKQGDLFPKTHESKTDTKNETSNPIIDYLDFEDGLEKAIASAFGEDLVASIDENQPIHWKNFIDSVKEKELFYHFIPTTIEEQL